MDYTWTKLYYGFIFLGDRNKCHVAIRRRWSAGIILS